LVILEELFPFGIELGYIGILLISFVSSLIPFVPIPYFPVLITASFNVNFNPHVIALVSALGIVGAKMIIFFAFYYGRRILSDKTKKRMRPLQNLVSRYGWFGAFIAALTPIPDDIVYIPLGLAKYNPWKFATATFAGRFLFNESIVWGSIILGRPFIESLLSAEVIDMTSLIIAAIVSTVVVTVIVYFSLRIDWSRVIGKWFPWTLKNNNEEDEEEKDRNDNNKSNDRHTKKKI
jgi:membrane protein DedA with SNARE-associated domain